MIVDTHIHLDDSRYDEDIDEVLDRAREAGVKRFIIPGADPKTLEKAVSISEANSDVYFAIGVHPYDMKSFSEEIFLKYVDHTKCVAIGECGLDYYRLEGSDEEKKKEKDEQKRVFVAQIEIAKKYKKPLIVHIRDASRDSKDLLLKSGAGEVGGVLHCYNADEELLALAKNGFYYGIGGVLTFKNTRKLLEVLPKIPLERLLIETDGPYLTPHPHRGKRNEPLYTTLVVSKISELLGLSKDEVAKISTKNSKELFGIS
ncbi:MAG: TatD family hydrolase [Sulfurimonadaceae bacterium]|nr:TatD family hydrolase [Sulfurimonadaceae bacterium]